MAARVLPVVRVFPIRGRVSLATAMVLSLALAGQALGHSWTQVPVTGWGKWPADLVILRDATAVVAFNRDFDDSLGVRKAGVFVKRSTDAGAIWGPRVTLSTTGFGIRIAGRGAKVDAVFFEETRVVYRRSTDGGLTFGRRKIVVEASADPDVLLTDWQVARGPDGLVAVMWAEEKYLGTWDDIDHYRTIIRARVSTDGGRSFGSAKTIAQPRGEHGGATLAIGNGVIYVAYLRDWSEVRIRRSLNAGATWSALTVIGPAFNGSPALVAAGRTAYVTFSTHDRGKTSIRYRRTTDRGATWSSPLIISSLAGTQARSEVLSLQGGVLRAAYHRCDFHCDVFAAEGMYFRESRDGLTWTKAQAVAPIGGYRFVQGVGYARKVLVLYRELMDDDNFDLHSRAVVARGRP